MVRPPSHPFFVRGGFFIIPAFALFLSIGPWPYFNGFARADQPDNETVNSTDSEIVVVRASRIEVADDPTAAATKVDAKQFGGEAKTVAELVATAPGVAVNNYGGLGQLTTISIRGSTADQVLVLLDGVPLNAAAGGGVDLSRIPRAWIERIEVVRGAEGALYGSGALGGVVNIITRKAAAGTWSSESMVGSFNTLGEAVDAAFGGEHWGLFSAAMVDSTKSDFPYFFDPTPIIPGSPLVSRIRVNNASFAAGGLAKLWADVGLGRLDSVVQVSGGSRGLSGTAYQLTPHDGQHDFRLSLASSYSQCFSDSLAIRVRAQGLYDQLDVTIAPQPQASQRDLKGSASASLLWTNGPSILNVTVGGSDERLDVVDAFSHERAGLVLGVADDLSLFERLRLGSALRWESQGRFSGWSAKLGGTLGIVGPLSARASAGRTFRAPSVDELYLRQGLLDPNPTLVPESAWSFDAGLVAEGWAGLASVTGFMQLYEDIIVYEPDSFRRLKPFNDARAVTRGIEAEVATTPFGPAGLTASAAYTFLDSETLKGEPAVLGKTLPHRARHRLFARVGTSYDFIGAHAEVHYVSQQFQDLLNTPAFTIPPVLTVNAGVSVRLWRHPEIKLNLEVRNLLDQRIVNGLPLQDGFGNPLPGRMVMVIVRVSERKD